MDQPLRTEESARRLSLTVELLRIGVGVIWAVNFVFIVAPANDYFGNFRQTALSFAPSTLGGPTLARFVGDHAAVFGWVVALLTGYLAVAFTMGLTTKWACLFGGIFSAVLLGTQVGSTFVFPGGTDVGEHPLYLLVYTVLIFGGAGQSLSVDHWISSALARRRASLAPRPLPVPGGFWAGGVNLRFLTVYFVAGVVIAFGIGAGLVLALPPASSPGNASPLPTSYENLTVNLNPVNGWPQFSPANFTGAPGRVIFTITDNDMPMNWSGCPCVVTGTNGSVEEINGSPTHIVSSDNVAHTFNVPRLGLSIYSPGDSVVRFTAVLLNPGTFQWFCVAPCGAGSDPYSTPPMGVAGYMSGTMTIS